MDNFVPIVGRSRVLGRATGRFLDERGYFSEEFRLSDCPIENLNFVQDSLSYSVKNVLRGMHVQAGQWQLITLIKGEIVDLVVDLATTARGNKTPEAVQLSSAGFNQLLVPPGVAHGYVVLSDDAIIHYKSSIYYGETPQYGFHWASEELIGLWPKGEWIVSERDSNFPVFQALLLDNSFPSLANL